MGVLLADGKGEKLFSKKQKEYKWVSTVKCHGKI